jgi:hypothetical protein
MRVEMPSMQQDDPKKNNWVEIRTDLRVKDRLAVQAVAKVQIGEDGNSVSMMEMENDMRNCLLGRIITAWSYPYPTPANNSFAAADVVIGDMDLDDYSVLEAAVQPYMDKISGRVKAPDPKKLPTS